MTWKLGFHSEDNLRGIHPDLVRVVRRAVEISHIEFMVLEGLRTPEKQAENIAKGVSWTKNSRHLTGHAVDIAPLERGKISWSWPLYYELAPVIKKAAADVSVPVEWGGDWDKNKDGPHWQLPWAQYPKEGNENA